MSYTEHYSVLKDECLDHLLEKEGAAKGLFADLTFGGGGHTKAILESAPEAHVIACDQDPEALANGKKLIEQNHWEERLTLLDMNFENFPEAAQEILKQRGKDGFHGIVMDLGVSSHHFDSSERGFSFRHEGPLDMRMNPRSDSPTAADILNEASLEELERILKEYGEEKLATRIAQAIVEQRKKDPFESTKDLENLVFHCYPKKWRYGKTHPSTRTFQALRIAVNRELEVLTEVISQLPELLLPGGRLLVISFHSLEDRIVKHAFKRLAGPKKEGPYQILTKKPIVPSEEEQKENARSRSAKLRVLERVVENLKK